MKRLLTYFLILLAAVWLGIKIQADPGYVLITYNHWSLETTFWFAALGSIVAFFTLYFLLRFISNSKFLPQRLQRWWYKYSEKRAIRCMDEGICKLLDGKYSDAEKKLLRSVRHSPNPFINYLSAATAAQKLNAYRRRDNYLIKASCYVNKSEFAIGILKTQMQIQSQQLELALSSARHLHSLNPKNTLILKLLKGIYLSLEDWSNLKILLPLLYRRKVFPNAEINQLEQHIYLQLMQKSQKEKCFSDTKNIWKSLPRFLRINPEIVYCYTHSLLQENLGEEAESLIRHVLKKNWHPLLLEIYAKTTTKKPSQQISVAEKWLPKHPNDFDLLLCLSRICKKQSLWGKSRTYLEKCLSLSPNNSKVYLELGEIMEKYDDYQQALVYYKKGLEKIHGFTNS